MLGECLHFIIEFIRLTTENSRHPKLDYVKECLMLLGDMITILPEQISKLAMCTFVADRVTTLVKFNKDGHLNQCISYVKQQFRLRI